MGMGEGLVPTRPLVVVEEGRGIGAGVDLGEGGGDGGAGLVDVVYGLPVLGLGTQVDELESTSLLFLFGELVGVEPAESLCPNVDIVGTNVDKKPHTSPRGAPLHLCKQGWPPEHKQVRPGRRSEGMPLWDFLGLLFVASPGKTISSPAL